MDRELQQLLIQILQLLQQPQQQSNPERCGGNCRCGCPSDDLLEGTAVRFNEQASQASAMALQNFVGQQASMQAALLKLQSDITKQ